MPTPSNSAPVGGTGPGRATPSPRDALVLANLRLAYWLAGPDEDARQVALLGLMRAAERFDPGLGFKFSTYAVWWIRAYVGRWLARERRWRGRAASLDAPGPDGEPLVDSLAHPGPAPDQAVALRGVEAVALAGLRGRARAIGADVYADRVLGDEPRTLEDIGREHGVCREYVRQVSVRVLEQLRAA